MSGKFRDEKGNKSVEDLGIVPGQDSLFDNQEKLGLIYLHLESTLVNGERQMEGPTRPNSLRPRWKSIARHSVERVNDPDLVETNRLQKRKRGETREEEDANYQIKVPKVEGATLEGAHRAWVEED